MAIMRSPGLARIYTLILNVLLLLTIHGHPVESPEDLPEALGQRFRTVNLASPQNGSAALSLDPDGMLELYHRFVRKLAATPFTGIVRVFHDQDFSHHHRDAGSIRKHHLLFNVSIPHYERIAAAELCLHSVVQQDQLLYPGQGRKVTIFEIREDRPGKKENGGGRGEQLEELTELASQHINSMYNRWETFNLTAAVCRWHNLKSAPHRLEVHISSTNSSIKMNPLKSEEKSRIMRSEGRADIDRNPEKLHRPLLIVFSDEPNRDSDQRQDGLKVMSGHGDEQDNLDTSPSSIQGEAEGSRTRDVQNHPGIIYGTKARMRRSVRDGPCRRTSLYVKFKDIGWDSWIAAPSGYEAYKCTGVCSFPLTEHVTPTKHAIVQTLVNLHSPQEVAQACCVPTQLGPISLMYREHSGVFVFTEKYENMTVIECGCR